MAPRKSPLLLGFVAALSALATACAGVTRVAEPPYAVEFREGPLEVRTYGPRVVAETETEARKHSAAYPVVHVTSSETKLGIEELRAAVLADAEV